jgi:chlorinating enzyme
MAAKPARENHDEAVAKLDREMRFFESKPKALKRLSEADVKFYNERGYLAGMRALDPERAKEVRERFDKLLQKFLDAGEDAYAIESYHDRVPLIYELATNPVIVDHATDLLGGNVVCWDTHFFCKMPGDVKEISWHQDSAYWPLTPTKTVTVWLAIDDADVENGCMRVIPGSHKHGLIKTRESRDDEKNVLTQTVDDPERYGDQAVDAALKAGEFSMHSDLLLHGSNPNRSDRRRCGLTLRYAPADVRAYWDWNKGGVVVAGEDPEGHWTHTPKPTEETAP